MTTIAKRFTVVLTALVLLTGFALGQTTLSAGDIAIFGVNCDSPDNFGFVLLVDIESGTEIRFTDSGWKSDNTFRGGEGALKYTAPTALTKGTEITWLGNSASFSSDNDTYVGTNGVALSASGDQLFAFQGTSDSPTFIYAVQTNSSVWQTTSSASTDSAIPQGLTNGVNAVAVGSGTGAGDEYDNAAYDKSTMSGTDSEILSAISDNTNWLGAGSPNYDLSTYDFTIGAGVIPIITLSTSSLSDFTYEVGNGPSEEQTFTASGSDLTEEIVLTAPTNYEISKSTGSNFTTDTLTLPQYGGSVSEKTIYVRLKSGLSIGDYNSEDITATSSGATNKTVTCSGSVTAVLPDIVINEILADPDATTGDANGDETVNTTQDEFVELVNKDGSSVDISGWKIYDSGSERHVFPEGTILANNTSIVVFGGGTPTGIPGLSQTASTGTLGLNNDGDDVIIKNASDVTVVSYTYGAEGGDNQSIARDPDFTGSFVKHSTITENPVDFSPGYMNAASDTPLPITLTSFTATAVNGTVELAWETATETNNARFVIYRNGEAIGSVEGAGTTTEPHSYTFVDDAVVPGLTYTYVLADVDYANTETKYDDDAVTVTLGNDVMEADFTVGAAYPNPFNPTAIVPFELTKDAMVKASVYDLVGREVKTLINGNVSAGSHELKINGENMTTGIYLVKVVIDNTANIQKIALMK